MPLPLATDFSLPDGAIHQRYAMIARTGAGKTYGAIRLVELFMGMGLPCVVFDPLSNWWGLRLKKDGKTKGFPIPVFGGNHGDVPLDPAQGAQLAEVLDAQNLSAVIDLSLFRKDAERLFVREFCEAFYELHRGASKRTPCMLVFEEAQRFAPQVVKDQALLEAVDDLVRLGRNFGISTLLLSQRAQSVNKEVLNQAEVLLVGQVNGKQDRDAIGAWVTEVEHGEKGRDWVDRLPTLQVGEMMLWSPQWLKTLRKVKITQRETLDVSKVAAEGAPLPPVGSLGSVDFEALRKALTAPAKAPTVVDKGSTKAAGKTGRHHQDIRSIPGKVVNKMVDRGAELEERVEVLQQEVARLKAQLGRSRTLVGHAFTELDKELEKVRARAHALCRELSNELDAHASTTGTVGTTGTSGTKRGISRKPVHALTAKERAQVVAGAELVMEAVNRSAKLPAHLRLVLALAEAYPHGLTQRQTGKRAGMSPKSSTFSGHWVQAKNEGLLESWKTGVWRATEQGRAAVGQPAGRANSLQKRLSFFALDQAPGRMLEVIARHDDGGGVNNEELSAESGYSYRSSTFSSHISVLKDLSLVDRVGGKLVLHRWAKRGEH